MGDWTGGGVGRAIDGSHVVAARHVGSLGDLRGAAVNQSIRVLLENVAGGKITPAWRWTGAGMLRSNRDVASTSIDEEASANVRKTRFINKCERQFGACTMATNTAGIRT